MDALETSQRRNSANEERNAQLHAVPCIKTFITSSIYTAKCPRRRQICQLAYLNKNLFKTKKNPIIFITFNNLNNIFVKYA